MSESVACLEAEPCSQQQSPGAGSFNMQRWFFDKQDYSCKPFLYKGIKGNQNNFMTKENCEKDCPVFVNPCANVQTNGRLISCSPADKTTCPANNWCHIGDTEETTVCCQGSNLR